MGKRIYFKADNVTVANIGPEHVPDLPEGVVMLTEGTLVVEDDVEVHIGMVYDVIGGFAYPTPDIEAARAAKRKEIDEALQSAFLQGFTVPSGPLAGHVLQCRDETDRTNWLTSAVGYSAAIAQGGGATAGATFRTAANETITCTFAQGMGTLLGMQMWGQSRMANSWLLKDALAAATTVEEIDAIDTASGW